MRARKNIDGHGRGQGRQDSVQLFQWLKQMMMMRLVLTLLLFLWEIDLDDGTHIDDEI
jgi:hypothetical protein